MPVDYKIGIDCSEDIPYKQMVSNGKVKHIWNIQDYKVQPTEESSLNIEELLPYVSIVPKTFTYVVPGSFDNWSSYGSWHYALNEDTDDLPDSEVLIINQLVDGLSNKKEIIKKLYNYMQDNTRYINVAIETGGLKPYPASYVCEKKYGDCKALTVYMKALLDKVGIPSYYTLIYAGNNPVPIKEHFPSQQFNHVVLTIPLEKDTIYLENTAGYLPATYVGTFIQDRSALLVDSINSRLINMPALKLNDVVESSNYEFNLDQEGNGDLTIAARFKGKKFEEFRYYQHHLNIKEQKQRIEEILNVEHYELKNWNFIAAPRNQEYIDIQAKLFLKQQFRQISYLSVLHPLPIEIPKLEPPEMRHSPLRINYPIHKTDTLNYVISSLNPSNCQLPENAEISSPFGKYKEIYQRSGKSIQVIKHFEMESGYYTKDQYKPIYDFIQSVYDIQKQSNIILKN